MSRSYAVVLASLFFVAASAFSSSANADVFRVIDVRARHIKAQSNVLMEEANNHYRGTPNYSEIVDNARMLRRVAGDISEIAKHRRNLTMLSVYMNQLDSTFHRLEDGFDRAEANAARNFGRVRGNTRHVKASLEKAEDDIHELQKLVDGLRQAELEGQRRAMYHQSQYGPAYGPVYYSPGTVIYSTSGSRVYNPRYDRYGRVRIDSGSSRGGASIGNGNFHFRIRF